MIKKKLEKHDFSTHEGLKKYIREYVKLEKENSRATTIVFYFMGFFMCFAMMYQYFFGPMKPVSIQPSNVPSWLWVILAIGLPAFLFYVANLERNLTSTYEEKLKEIK